MAIVFFLSHLKQKLKGKLSARCVKVEQKTSTKAILESTGIDAPYNGEPEYSINTEKAQQQDFEFTNLKDWIYDLIDSYINLVQKSILSN